MGGAKLRGWWAPLPAVIPAHVGVQAAARPLGPACLGIGGQPGQ